MSTPQQRIGQLPLPMYGEARTKSLKTSISGTVSDPRDQPGRALEAYEKVAGVFFGEVVHSGGDATYETVAGEEKRAPTHVQKITASQVLLPLSDSTKRALRELFERILDENRAAAHRIGLLDENEEPKAS